MSEHTDTLEIEVLRDDATILLAPGGALECLDKRGLAIVRPAGIDMVRRLGDWELKQTNHSTGCASFSRTTLIVAQEKRTSEGYPKVGSNEFLIHACVFGSTPHYQSAS